jgi:hypothetical protein
MDIRCKLKSCLKKIKLIIRFYNFNVRCCTILLLTQNLFEQLVIIILCDQEMGVPHV